LKCEKCNKKHDGKFGSGRYCSRKCANSRIFSDESKLKTSLSLKGRKINPESRIYNTRIARIETICPICNIIFIKKINSIVRCCGKSCGIIFGGRQSAQNKNNIRRSKNEIYFAELCNKKYNILTNIKMFNGWDADVILIDLKIAILWNGVWHRKKITKKHSVEQVKNRDKIKINEIVKHGFIPYIIEDDGKFKKSFVENMFILLNDFINNFDGNLK
jgi:hypothetical protein